MMHFLPFSRKFRPMTLGSAANMRCQRAYEIVATGVAPGTSSSLERLRPKAGSAPKSSSSPPVTKAALARAGSAAEEILTPASDHASKDCHDFVARWRSRYSDLD